MVEVKGGSVWYDEEGWWQQRGRREATRSTRSSRSGRRSTRSATTSQRDPRWNNRNHVAWGHAVVTPYSDFPADFAAARLPALVAARPRRPGRPRGAGPRQRRARARRASPPRPTTTSSSSSTSSPAACATSYDVNAEAEERAASADRLTHGAGHDPAGHPAAQPRSRCAAAPAAARPCSPSSRPSSSPAAAATARPSGSPCSATRSGSPSTSSARSRPGTARHRPAFVGTFHEFGKQWGAPDGDRTDSDFWEVRAARPDGRPRRGAARRRTGTTPSSSTRRRTSPTPGGRPVLKSLRDEEEGGLYVYSDENQRIFARFGRPPVAAGPAGARPQPPQHPADPRVVRAARAEPHVRAAAATVRPSGSCRPSPEDAIGVADDEVDALLEAGWRARERLPAHHRPPAPGADRAHRLPRPGRLLEDVLGHRRRLLRPRPRLQGARAPRRRPLRQRATRRATAPASGCTSGCRAPPTSSSSSATRR